MVAGGQSPGHVIVIEPLLVGMEKPPPAEGLTHNQETNLETTSVAAFRDGARGRSECAVLRDHLRHPRPTRSTVMTGRIFAPYRCPRCGSREVDFDHRGVDEFLTRRSDDAQQIGTSTQPLALLSQQIVFFLDQANGPLP